MRLFGCMCLVNGVKEREEEKKESGNERNIKRSGSTDLEEVNVDGIYKKLLQFS